MSCWTPILVDVPSTTCGWCGRLANMTFARSSQRTLIDRSRWGDVYRLDAVYSCDNCKQFLLATVTLEEHEIEIPNIDDHLIMHSFNSSLKWMPAQGAQPPAFTDVPEHIREAAQEAYRCRSINAHRAAVLLARSVIEATAKDKGIVKGMLADKIDAMYERHIIFEHVRDGAHEVRHLGNDMAHGDFVDPVAEEESEDLLVLMSEVLRQVFESPAQVARARAAREAKKAVAADGATA